MRISDWSSDVCSSDLPEYVGQIGTTCVPTLVKGGHAENALPQRATANINCRIFPGVPVETVRAELEKVLADPAVKVNTDPDASANDAPPQRPHLKTDRQSGRERGGQHMTSSVV